MNYQEERLSRFAEVLSKHPCQVRFRIPIYKDVAGLFSRSEDFGRIDLNPNIEIANNAHIFFHEVAHCFLQWDETPVSESASDLENFKINISSFLRSPVGKAWGIALDMDWSVVLEKHDKDEAAADEQAKKWMKKDIYIEAFYLALGERNIFYKYLNI